MPAITSIMYLGISQKKKHQGYTPFFFFFFFFFLLTYNVDGSNQTIEKMRFEKKSWGEIKKFVQLYPYTSIAEVAYFDKRPVLRRIATGRVAGLSVGFAVRQYVSLYD